MNTLKLSVALTIAGLIAAPSVLAQSSSMMTPKSNEPVFQNPGGVAGGFANSTAKTAAAKQDAQSLVPPVNQDEWENGQKK
jgi:hypothetical protein